MEEAKGWFHQINTPAGYMWILVWLIHFAMAVMVFVTRTDPVFEAAKTLFVSATSSLITLMKIEGWKDGKT